MTVTVVRERQQDPERVTFGDLALGGYFADCSPRHLHQKISPDTAIIVATGVIIPKLKDELVEHVHVEIRWRIATYVP